jgi:N-acyl-phosphatidylethanolamine-hydrolysing phospholipase D
VPAPKKQNTERHFGSRAIVALIVCYPRVLVGCLSPRPFDEAAWQAKVEDQRTPKPSMRPIAEIRMAPFSTHGSPKTVPGGSSGAGCSRKTAWAPLADEDPDTPVVANDGAYLTRPRTAPDSLTWVGHATFVVQWTGQVVITDPFFSERAAVVKRKNPPSFKPAALPDGFIVLISHNHYDHMDSDSLEALLPRAGLVLCPLGLGDWLKDLGAKEVREVDWWQSVEVGGTRFTSLPTQHWSRRFGQSYNQTLWCSWLMERGGKKVYYGADSGYFVGYREFGKRYPDIDVALLPLGAYYPRWFMHYAHMNLSEVMKAFEDLGAREMVPMQWGVLPLGDEPPAHPRLELEEYLDQHPELQDRVKVLPVGGRLMLD